MDNKKFEITITMKMNLKMITIMLGIVLICGCSPQSFWNDLTHLQFKAQPETVIPIINDSPNITNTTTTPVENSFNLVENKTNIIITKDSLLFIENNQSYLIDVPEEAPTILSYLTQYNLNELSFLASTIDKKEHNGGVKYVVVKSPPKVLFDNGLDNPERQMYKQRLDMYNSYWGRQVAQYEPMFSDTQYTPFIFFVPYDTGFLPSKEENSITVEYKQFLLYMSDCVNGCEKTLPPLNIKILILANNGVCPTNTFDFILSTGAQYVIGQEICETLKTDLDMIGIKYIEMKNSGDVQIIYDGTNYVINKKNG